MTMPRVERELDSGDTPLLRFAGDLRRLRRRAGNPAYRQLAQRAFYSAATLSEAASGRKLPTLAVTLAYVRACDGDEAQWEDRWHALAAELAAESHAAADHAGPAGLDGAADHAEAAGPGGGAAGRGGPGAPYAGLAAFQPADADLFFGRERLAGQVLAKLAEHRLMAVFGASGAGKSSLLRAGLMPRWAAERPERVVVLLTPGEHPLEECAVRLAGLVGAQAGAVHAELRDDPRGLHRIVRQALAGRPDDAELLLVVDQFEETFTLCADPAERGRFIAALTTAARATRSACRIVLGVRADFYPHCTAYAELVAEMRDAQVTVGPMSADELRRAISEPAVRTGHAVASDLLATLVADAGGVLGVLPLLSHALRETWQRRRGNTLTLAGYQAAGGIEGALAHTAESLFRALTPAQQRRARQLLLRLTALGDGTEDTKRRLHRDEAGLADPDTRLVVDRLTAARLLTVDRDSIEITHESLIRRWPRLHGWLTENREALRVHRRLTEAAGLWRSMGRDPGALYRGAPLTLAEEWAASRDGLNGDEAEFLETSLAARAAETAATQRRGRRMRRLVGLLSVLCLVATGTTGLAVRAQRAAAQQRDAVTSLRAADRADALRVTSPALAAQLSLAAYRLSPTLGARGSVLSSFAVPYATQLAGVGDVTAVGFSPDGRVLATGGKDHAVRLWAVEGARNPRWLTDLRGHTSPVRAVTFGSGGKALAAAGEDGTVRLWDVTDLSRPRPLAERRDRLRLLSAADASAGSSAESGTSEGASAAGRQMLAATGRDGTVRLWDSGRLDRSPRRLRPVGGSGGGIAVSPDGRTMATGGTDRTVRLWDLVPPGGPRELAALAGHTDEIRSVAFSADGRTLVSGGVDANVRLWSVSDPRHPRELAVLPGHTTAITAVALSPDGHLLATASADQSLRLWELSGSRLVGHESSVYAVAFGPGGRTLATGSYDRTIRLWDLTRPGRPRQGAVLHGHDGPVNDLAFRPGNDTPPPTGPAAQPRNPGPDDILASASNDRTVRLWDSRTGVPLARISYSHSVEAVAFSPDGQLLAAATADGKVRLSRLAGPSGRAAWRIVPVATLAGHAGVVEAVQFRPDGAVLATGSADRTVRLWDVTKPAVPGQLAVLSGHAQGVKTVAFHPGGRLLASGSEDGTARLWEVTDPRRPVGSAVLTGYADGVMAAAFSPDGRSLATASSDKTVRLWAVADHRHPAEQAILTGHAKPVDALAYGPGGQTLATGGEDWTTLLWDVSVDRVAERICAGTDPAPLRSGWDTYFPGREYRAPCG
jgi:WD40 repeat protein